MSNGAGPLLKEWRARRRRSQMDLANEVGMSTKHLSFVETGRATPSRELLLTLAGHLDVPFRDRNSLLLAAGYAPRFSETGIDDPAMKRVLSSLQRLLATHDPYPGVVLDRRWNVVLANASATALLAGLPAELLTPTTNIFRISLHPDGLAAITLNFDEWARYLLGQLRRLVMTSGDPELATIELEVLDYPGIAGLATPSVDVGGDEPALLIPCRLTVDGAEWSLFTTLTTFGTPRDITLHELAIELFFPADDATEALLRNSASGGTAKPQVSEL